MGQSGQATVEFLVVTVAFLAVVVGMGALADGLAGGLLVDSATESAPYTVDDLEGIGYVLMF